LLLQPPLTFDFPETLDLPHSLYDYQPDGIKFLTSHDSALLGDEMGLGKTVQTVVAMRLLFQTGKIRSALVVCPKSVVDVWDRHLQDWAPHLSVCVIKGDKAARERKWLRLNPYHVRVATYDAVRQDIDFILDSPEDTHYDLVVLDECQKIKNPETGYASATKALRCSWRWALSGTPIENEVGDLISIFDFVKPGLLSGLRSPYAWGVTPAAASEAIQPYFLRRRKQDVLKDLPSMTVEEIWLSLDGRQREAYERAEREGVVHIKELGEDATVIHVLELLTRLKQICNLDPKSGESIKLHWLTESLDQMVLQGDKALIFSQYREHFGVRFLCSNLEAYRPLGFTGDMTTGERKRALDAFAQDPEHPLLVLTLKTGGLGLSLTAANYVVLFDHWWNPATGQQAGARIHRPGQTKPVWVYQLWIADTVDDRIYAILARKKDLFNQVIDSLSADGSKLLTEEELFGLFGLTAPKRSRSRGPSDDWQGLTPSAFEEKVAQLWQKMGYGVRLTPATRDHGIDIITTRETVGGVEKAAIQCKHQKQVGVEVARALLGVVEADRSFAKGIIVTSGQFSQDCKSFAQSVGHLELVDGPRLSRLFSQFEVSP
jgi:SNF2 family DNA or RNA helicase